MAENASSVKTADERINAPISRGELERRWKAARAEMSARGLGALVMQNTNDWLGGYVKWFTDVPAQNGYPRTVIFHADGLMSVIEMGPFGGRREAKGDDPLHPGVGEFLHTPSFFSIAYTGEYDADLAVDVLKRRNYAKVGLVGPGALPNAFLRKLTGALGNTAFEDATDFVDRLKAIKSEEEQEAIRATARMQDATFEKILAYAKPGMRDIDVVSFAQHTSQVVGSEQGIFLGFSAPVGRRAGFIGRHFQGRRIAEGDHMSVLIENNGPGGFYCEIARTMVFGKASQELLDGFAAVKEAQDHTLALLKPGAQPAEIAAAHDDFMRKRGLPPEIRLYSHGQGYDMVERPLIRRDETMAIEAGMNLAVHPGYETPSIFAVICDNYIVDEAGPGACLHDIPKRIFEL